MSKEDWIYMPHAGHLCIAQWCRFHLNTYVNGYIVSTVGEYLPPADARRCILEAKIINPIYRLSKEEKEKARSILNLIGDPFDHEYLKEYDFDDLGYNRKYETIVFKSKKSGLPCCPYVMDSATDLYMDGYMTSEEAFNGHNEICEDFDREKPTLI